MANITRTPAIELSGQNIGTVVTVDPNENTRVRGVLTGVHHDSVVILTDWTGAPYRTELRVTLVIDKVGEITAYAGTPIDVEHE